MCGIVGISGKHSSEELIKSLKRLEYRGYDSFGFANNNGICAKRVGHIDLSFADKTESNISIAHTRWATHGGVTEINSHPHFSCDKNIMVVHNGIIENYEDLKNALIEKGHVFVSQTDTEVIAHYFEEMLKTGGIHKAVKEFFSEVRGTFAILLIRKGIDEIVAIKRDSPLVLGLCKDRLILASDIYAFSDKTNRAIFFDDDEYAIVSQSNYDFFDKNGMKIEKDITSFEWNVEEEEKKFDHYMIKEIYEQPKVSQRLIRSLETDQKNKLEKVSSTLKNMKKVVFIAMGTSYHAGLVGSYIFRQLGIESYALNASEYEDYPFIDDNTALIAISQSGETMDLITALKFYKEKGAKIISLVNVPYSTIQRMSDLSFNILAGQEICVAATKSFTNQVILISSIAKTLGLDFEFIEIAKSFKNVLDQEDIIKEIAVNLKGKKDIYIIGRGLLHAIASEIALKLKEISYIHTEGMMAAELKHGTIALIDKGTPVISLAPKGDEDIISNSKEVEARGADVLLITNRNTLFKNIKIETDDKLVFALSANMIGQLLTYYVAKENGLPIDKPRNLAKSVTVK